MILYEIQLLNEKILELQKSYHNEFKRLYNNYDKEKRIIKLIQNNKALLTLFICHSTCLFINYFIHMYLLSLNK